MNRTSLKTTLPKRRVKETSAAPFAANLIVFGFYAILISEIYSALQVRAHNHLKAYIDTKMRSKIGTSLMV
jgi:hypothetical protein